MKMFMDCLAVGLLQGGKPMLGLLYVSLSVVLCLGAVALMQAALK